MRCPRSLLGVWLFPSHSISCSALGLALRNSQKRGYCLFPDGPKEQRAQGEPARSSARFCESWEGAWFPLENWILGFMLKKAYCTQQGDSSGEDGSGDPSPGSAMAVWKHQLGLINKMLLLLVVARGWKLL